jgi:murein DD-endopeptidase MepM/ murein hydrolase activator NlpD
MTRVVSTGISTALFFSVLLAGSSSAETDQTKTALDIAAGLPERHAAAARRSDIAETAEATMSSIRGIIDLMKQAQEVTAMLPRQRPERAVPLSPPKTGLEIALSAAAKIPDRTAANKPEAQPAAAVKKPAAQPAAALAGRPALPTSQQLIWPADGFIYSAFNASRGRKKHGAIDIVAKKGTPIAAAADGIVSVAANGGKNFSGYGKIVILDHGKGLYTVYAHCDTIIVKMGQKVKQGEYIATVGRTGRATTDHVHFEVRLSGKKYDPLAYLPSRPGVVKATDYHSPKKKK